MDSSTRLLIVEPNEAIRRLIALAGKPFFLHVDVAGSLREAQSLLERRPDVVLSELRLPDGDGKDVFDYYRTNTKDPVFVALTAVDDVAAAVRLMRDGAFAVLPKPFGLDEIGLQLGRALQQHSVLTQSRKSRELERRYHVELEHRVGEQTALISNLLDFANRLNSTQRLEDAVELTLGTLRDMLHCQRISILLETPETGQIAIADSLGVPREILRRPIDLEDSPVVRRVMEGAEVVYVQNVADCDMGRGRGDGRSFMSVPLVDGTSGNRRVFGVVNLTDRDGSQDFDTTERRLVQSIADSASVACANLRNRRDLEKSYFDTVGALANALEAKDHYTHGHSQRVTSMCMIVADVMGFANEQLDQIMFAGMLHDVGKIGIPESILHKPGRLTDEEFSRIKEHPAKGERMVNHISFLSSASGIIRHHHERFDGRGYPDGLRGQEIELPARVMAIADSYDAMTTDRSYRRRLPAQQVHDELIGGRGTQFDPDVLDLFMAHVATSRNIPQFAS